MDLQHFHYYRRRHHRGFSIVELLISLVILAIGLVGLVQLYIASVYTYQKTRYTSLATARAKYELERVLQLGAGSYDALTNPGNALIPACYPSNPYTALSSGRGVKAVVSELPNGQVTITIVRDPFNQGRTEDLQLSSVTVAVTWTGPRMTSDVQLVTYVAKRPGGA